jgi:hypothetical protein
MARGRSRLALCAVALAAWLPPRARADRYEASIAVRPGGQLARIADRGTGARATVPGAGLAGGPSWGVRNWLDLGGELAASFFAEARYELATLPVGANPRTGRLSRRTRIVQLRGLATLRLGVGWIPTIQLLAGAGARQRSAARLQTQVSQAELVRLRSPCLATDIARGSNAPTGSWRGELAGALCAGCSSEPS